MSLLVLPVELLNAVCQHLESDHLVVLSRTCATLSPIAQRLLYRVLAISHATHNLDVVLTLAARPHLALFVRDFSIVIDAKTVVFNSYYRALANALSRMTELTSLNIRVDTRVSWILGLTPPQRPRLRHFSSSFLLDSFVATFLQQTPALEELELDSSAPPSAHTLSLPPSSLPRLIHFVGPTQAAKVIVPGRPVQRIHVCDEGITEHEVACFAQSTAPIAVLDAMTTSLVVPLLQSLAHHLPYLSYLRVAPPSQLSDGGFAQSPLPDATFYEQVSSALTMLPELSEFELSGTHWASLPVHEKGSQKGPGRMWQRPSFSPALPLVAPRDEYFEHFSDFGFNDFAFGF